MEKGRHAPRAHRAFIVTVRSIDKEHHAGGGNEIELIEFVAKGLKGQAVKVIVCDDVLGFEALGFVQRGGTVLEGHDLIPLAASSLLHEAPDGRTAVDHEDARTHVRLQYY